MRGFKRIPSSERLHGYRHTLLNGNVVEVLRVYPGVWDLYIWRSATDMTTPMPGGFMNLSFASASSLAMDIVRTQLRR